MTLAIVLVIAAALALIVIFGITVSLSLQLPADASLAKQIQPLDIEAFRNLIDPAEREYLRRRLPASEFRLVQRKRLRAMAAYVLTARRNADILADIGKTALSSTNPRTAEAARQLIDNAILLRSNTYFAFFRICVAMAWPDSSMAAKPVLHGYERLSGSAMLLGRLQNPAVPVRISAN
jgi:hypothetical protein